MDARLNQKLAHEHAVQLHRRAEVARLEGSLPKGSGRGSGKGGLRRWLRFAGRRARRREEAPALRGARIRYAGPCDEQALGDLAGLDSARVPLPPILVAEVDGRLRAAVSLTDSSAVADPFHLTADLVAALRDRADALRASSGDSATRHAPAWRPALGAQQEESG